MIRILLLSRRKDQGKLQGRGGSWNVTYEMDSILQVEAGEELFLAEGPWVAKAHRYEGFSAGEGSAQCMELL